MAETCKIRSLYSCQNRFLETHKEVDLAQHPVVGLALGVGDVAIMRDKLARALCEQITSHSEDQQTQPLVSTVWLVNDPWLTVTLVLIDGGGGDLVFGTFLFHTLLPSAWPLR